MLAKSLVKLWKDNPEKIKDIYNEGGQGGFGGGPDYWLDLQPGWMNEDGTHGVPNYTAADVVREFKESVQPCDMGKDGQPCCM